MTDKKQKRNPRSYTDEFKQQLVLLYQNGKRKCDICREYDIATSLLQRRKVNFIFYLLKDEKAYISGFPTCYWKCGLFIHMP